ncbi:MAG: hypothetical protein IT531_11850 [Burkholderiales bacterium]|nr:hypothetical protein [Burkholderiales bacterium]
MKVLGIGALALAPVVASYLLYVFWLPSAHTNYGTLLEPRALPARPLQTLDGKPFAFDQLRGRWVFVALDSGGCTQACEDKLWKMRQVRQTQGKDIGRIERVLVILDSETPAESIARDYAGTWLVRADAVVAATFPAPASNRNHIYLVDPLGNVMMRFPQDADPSRMLKDIARLLKYSHVG